MFVFNLCVPVPRSHTVNQAHSVPAQSWWLSMSDYPHVLPHHLNGTSLYLSLVNHPLVMFDIAVTMHVMLRMFTTYHVLIGFALL